MKILLVCSAGMSTSLLVDKMQKYCAKNNIEADIEAKGAADAKRELDDWDCILIGPQVKFMKSDIEKLTNKPCEVIPANIYALGKAQETMELAMKLLKK